MVQVSYYERACDEFHVRPDSKGECWITCPRCGKGTEHGHGHCSFSEHGWHCFVCGAGGSLAGLLGEDWHVRPVLKPKTERVRKALENAHMLAYQYAMHPHALEAWTQYKAVDYQMLRERRLGVGVFPQFTSKCPHERLMVPLASDGNVVGFRGRQIGCDCGKWLSPGGSRMVLYNGARILAPGDRGRAGELLLGDTVGKQCARGDLLVICENPIDALLWERKTGKPTVATLGVSIWKDEWTRALTENPPSLIVVQFDNDLPGNGGGKHYQRLADEWRAKHQHEPPEPAGVRLANRLTKAGLRVMLYDWGDAPEKADIGSFLA